MTGKGVGPCIIVAMAVAVLATTVEGSPRALLKSLEQQTRVTIGEGVRVTAVYAGLSRGDDDEISAHRGLVRANLLRAKDATDFKATLNRGLACYLFFRAMRMKGGWMTRTFGVSPRYAYKEFVAKGLISPDGENTPIGGPELLSLLKLATTYRAHGTVRLREN